jgi:hypothetical protein
MRTTVTLEPDVEALIRTAMKTRGLSFKDVLNSALRAGLTSRRPRRPRFVQTTVSLGAEQNFRWDKALSVAEAIEDEEIGRKLWLRK